MNIGKHVFAPGGGGASKIPQTLLAGFTETDPGGIKQASSQGAAVGSIWPGMNYVNAQLQTPATVSGLPNTGLRWTRPTRGLRGQLRNSDMIDLIAAVFGLTSDAAPLSADLVLGWFITNATVGFGGGIQAVAGPLWQVFGLSQTAGGGAGVGTGWTLTASGGASSASTVGSRHAAITSNVANQKLFRPLAMDSTLSALNTGAGVTMGALTIADGLNIFGMFAGWGTGVGGTTGTTVKLAAAEVLVDQDDLV